ncbi:hypothetical protein [Pedobacter sp. V48]|uniref:hypothetical protein n=1 Tax=Pedobacter sp. V48 TaxID=509635 RepID=UPI0003E4A8D6|nr:hypothetical protein [Pedobacter sp. V48]ETZ21668.1 hypothetical protein N824_27500 [Pedobacter sp. V48]
MKKLFLLAMLGFASIIALTAPAKAQVNISVNIGSQPQWGPRGYDYVDYYYMPDIESYYYVPTRQFIYLNGNRWVHSRSLPHRYRGYNLYSGRKYVINSPRPYHNHNAYRVKYGRHDNWKGNKRHYTERYREDRHHDNGRRQYRERGNDRRRDNRHYENKRERRDPGIERIIRPRG